MKLILEVAQEASTWITFIAQDQRLLYCHAQVIQSVSTTVITMRMLVLPAPAKLVFYDWLEVEPTLKEE